jgi:hypothetical protein
MARKSQVLPVEAWIHSSVMEKWLQELVRDGLLRPRTSRDLPEWWVPPTNHREPAPPEGYVASFVAFHERELHHLTTNSILQAAIFTAVYEGYLGIEPHKKLWLHLFNAEHFAKKAGERVVRRAVHAESYTL